MLTSSDYSCLVSESFLCFLLLLHEIQEFHPLLQSLLHLYLAFFLLQGISFLETEMLFVYLYKYACFLITAVSIWSINIHNILLYNEKLLTPFYKQRTEAQTARFTAIQKVCLKTGNCMPSSQVLIQHCFSSSSFITAVVKKVFLLSNSFLCLHFLRVICLPYPPIQWACLVYLACKFLKRRYVSYTKLVMSMYNYDTVYEFTTQ